MRARASRARRDTDAETADSSSKAAPVVAATIRASVVFPIPGGPKKIAEPYAVLARSHAQRRALAEHVLLADEVRRASAAGARMASGAVSGSRSRSRVGEKRSSLTAAKYAQHVSRQEQTGLADEFAPILAGPGASDYERYLRTDELLALQKTPDERAHHDELLFQTVHQSSELWLKLAGEEMELATTAPAARARSRPRCGCCGARSSASGSSRRRSTCSS